MPLVESIKVPLRWARNWLSTLPYYGKGRLCPVCRRSSRRFRGTESLSRGGGIWIDFSKDEALCIHCGARERHRFVWLYFNRQTDLFNGQPKRTLHVAPEKCFESRLRERLGAGYITADLMNPRAMVRMDITNIEYPDESFDVIYCSHVLEHVPEDRRAIKEFHRVLKKRGWAVLLVPIMGERTIEDPSIVHPLDRLRVFGDSTHVRLYGPDYVDRLREAGFAVSRTRVSDLFDKDEVMRMGLTSESGDIYYCTKE